jgi:hypothetical protein
MAARNFRVVHADRTPAMPTQQSKRRIQAPARWREHPRFDDFHLQRAGSAASIQEQL